MQIMDKAAGTQETVRPVLTKIAGKFQVTVPPEVRGLFDLREGDLLEWSYDHKTGQLLVTPKRAQLLTAKLREVVEESKKRRAEMAVETSV